MENRLSQRVFEEINLLKFAHQPDRGIKPERLTNKRSLSSEVLVTRTPGIIIQHSVWSLSMPKNDPPIETGQKMGASGGLLLSEPPVCWLCGPQEDICRRYLLSHRALLTSVHTNARFGSKMVKLTLDVITCIEISTEKSPGFVRFWAKSDPIWSQTWHPCAHFSPHWTPTLTPRIPDLAKIKPDRHQKGKIYVLFKNCSKWGKSKIFKTAVEQ